MKNSAPFDFDPVLTSRARLAVLSALVSLGRVEFVQLKDLLNMTQGNLSVHAGKLEMAGYIRIDKAFVDKKPRTTFEITRRGREALVTHVNKIKNHLGE